MKSSQWFINEEFTLRLALNMLGLDFKSVLTEELIFRGALLFILIQRVGASKAIALSAIGFGVYHWFSFGIVGSVVPMIVIFIGTGLMGYAWALAFSKTKSMLMPFGLHLGWNFTLNTIFSKGPYGDGLLIVKGGTKINDLFSLVGLWIIPLIVFFIVKYLIPTDKVS